MTTDHEAKAREIATPFAAELFVSGSFPKLVSAIAKALQEAAEAERERCLRTLSGEVMSVTLGDGLIAKGITEQDMISLINQFMIIARGAVKANKSGVFEESGATVDVTELAATIRSKADE